MTIRTLPSVYAGIRFRSRLEARWAIFFDKLGVSWEYEPEGFDLDGVAYLPDFRLHIPALYHLGEIRRMLGGGSRESCETHIYAEVKPRGGDFSKADRLPSYVAHWHWPAEYCVTAAVCLRLEGPPDSKLLTGAACVLESGRDHGGLVFYRPEAALVLGSGRGKLLIGPAEKTKKSAAERHRKEPNWQHEAAAAVANNYRFDRRP